MASPPTDPLRVHHFARAESQYRALRSVVRIVATALLLALGLRSLIFEPFNIPSRSMLPTLLAGDYLFVAKWPYGYSRYSLPLGLPLFDGRTIGSAPERGDVVVFKTPRDNRTDFIKRVVGLPGDRVRMVGGVLELNGVAVRKRRVGDFRAAASGRPTPQYAETLGGRTYLVLDLVAGGVHDTTPLMTVPPGHYFVAGDNRDDSADSRLTVAQGGVGMVPAENLIGRADRIFFSVDDDAAVGDPRTWLGALRLARIGRAL